MTKTIPRTCRHCKRDFQASLKEVNRGNGHFCSRSCSSKQKRSPASNCLCQTCKTPFYRSPSRRKTKSGYLFCSRKCKELAQTIGTDSSLYDMMPAHYKSGNTAYRRIAFSFLPVECNRCHYAKIPEVLQVHHKDRDRSNNQIHNLEILCPTCHEEDHFLNRDGRFT